MEKEHVLLLNRGTRFHEACGPKALDLLMTLVILNNTYTSRLGPLCRPTYTITLASAPLSVPSIGGLLVDGPLTPPTTHP